MRNKLVFLSTQGPADGCRRRVDVPHRTNKLVRAIT